MRTSSIAALQPVSSTSLSGSMLSYPVSALEVVCSIAFLETSLWEKTAGEILVSRVLVLVLECFRKYVSRRLPPAKKGNLPSQVVCARGKGNPAGDASEIEKENGDVRQRGDYNIRTAVLYEYSYVLESRVASFDVQHTWHLVHGTYKD